MTSPVVTVLMATYNQAQFLPQALAGLQAQTLPATAFEVVVVNDGSTDGTAAVLDRHRDFIRLVECPHRGLVASLSAGLALVRGHYLARHDSDDFVEPEWLERLVAVGRTHPEASCIYPERYELSGSQRQAVRVEAGNLYALEACGTLLRTEAVRAAGGFRPFYWEEYDLYLRLRAQGPFLGVQVPLYTYRKHPESMTSDPSRRVAGWVELIQTWGAETLLAAGRNQDLTRAVDLLAKGNGNDAR